MDIRLQDKTFCYLLCSFTDSLCVCNICNKAFSLHDFLDYLILYIVLSEYYAYSSFVDPRWVYRLSLVAF